MGTAIIMKGKFSAFARVSAAAALSAVLLAGGGCGDKELPDILANSVTAAQPAQKAAEGEITKSSLSKGKEFAPDMLGLQPGGVIGELRFNWYSAAGDANSLTFVRVFEGETLVASAEGTSGAAVENYLWHKADVSGLKPGTAYTYWVSNDGENWSNEYEYKSPSATGLFRFAAISDAQFDGSVTRSGTAVGTTAASDLTQWLAIAEKIASEDVSLIVNAGDHVEYCDRSSEGQGEKSYEYYFSPPMLRRIPTAPVMGNHDMCKNFDYHFNPPNTSAKTERNDGQWTGVSYYYSNYYFLSNRVLFVGLNTSLTPANDAAAKTLVDDYTATIQQAKVAHKGKYDFLVVMHHKTTTSTSYYGHAFDAEIIRYVNGGLQKMMTSEGVDVVFTGHDHMYVKSRLIDNDSVDLADEDQVKRSTLYLTLKPSGRTRNYNCDGSGANCVDDVGFDVAGTRAQYVSSYPFLQKYWRTGTSSSDNGKRLYVPWSLKNISTYNPKEPGYAIVEVAYGKMTIYIKDHNGNEYDRIELDRKSPIGIIATGRSYNL